MSDSDHRASDARLRLAPRRPIWLPSFGSGAPGLWITTLVGSARTRLGTVFEREMEEGRGFLWLPVLFGLGVLVYFALPREPSAAIVVVLALALAFGAAVSRNRTTAFRILLAFAAVAAGLAAMKLRTDLVAAPIIPREMTTTVTGWIQDREEASRGGTRIRVRPKEITGIAERDTPAFVRFTVRSNDESLAVGDAITATVRLQPPSGPVLPGGFDFARAAFYDRVGAIGFAYGAAKPATIGAPPLAIELRQPLAALRDTIRRRVEQALPGDNGHIAAALIMGDQRGISERVQEDMRASGLGHILSISGLHLALVAGSAFWLIRALLALSPSLALARPIKKWAAAGALAVATFYLGISGAQVATVRSFVMLAVMLTAIMIDRRALTLRNVALAALVILAFNPESLLSISFQMSFAATVALVAAYEAIAARADRRLGLAERTDLTMLGRVGQAALAMFLTSLIAGLATAPFSIFHFQRVAPLTLIANIAVAPVVGLVVMPMAIMGVLLMPFGLEGLPLQAMSYGLDWLVAVAEKTTEWSEGWGGMRMPPQAALLLAVAGFLWLALWRERWRLAGLIPICLALPIALLAPRPDVLIAASGEAAAVRAGDGRYRIIGGKEAKFEVENWLRADADLRPLTAKELYEDVACDALGCVAKLAGGGKVSLVVKPDAFSEDCRLATIVAARIRAPAWCAKTATVIDREKLKESGAVALYLEEDAVDAQPRFRIERSYPLIRRPFMPPLAAVRN